MVSTLLKSLNNLVDIYISGNNINNELGVNHERENTSLPTGVNIIISGLLILYIKRIAVYAVMITAIVDVCSFDMLSKLAKNTNNNIFTTVVIPLGIALLITFMKNLPFTLDLFGSSARINAGIPIVKLFIKVICIGIKGYV